jgi:hypothetical protein
MVGSFAADFSNGWNFRRHFFQRLEILTPFFPMVGTFRRAFSNDWKFCAAIFQ